MCCLGKVSSGEIASISQMEWMNVVRSMLTWLIFHSLQSKFEIHLFAGDSARITHQCDYCPGRSSDLQDQREMQGKAGRCNTHRCGVLLKTFPGAFITSTGSKWGLWQHLLWSVSLHIDDLSSCHITCDLCLHIDYAVDSNYKRRHQIVFFFYYLKIFHSSPLFSWNQNVILCPNVHHCHRTPPSCPLVHPSSTLPSTITTEMAAGFW